MTNPALPRGLAGASIALLVLVHVGLYAATMLSADSVRDLSTAWQLHAHGQWPAQGPDIFSRHSLGPLWFWLLAGLMKLTPSLTALVLCVGMLGSLKFPLAYLLGRRVGGELNGLIASCLLAVTSVSLIEYWTFAHTNLVVTCGLLVLWLGARLHAQPGDRDWVLFALALVLAIHAHPSAALSGLAAVPALWRHRTHSMSLPTGLAIALILGLAFLPSALFAWNGSLWYAAGDGGAALTRVDTWPMRTLALSLRVLFDPLRLLVETLGGAQAWLLGWIGIAVAATGVSAALLLARSRLPILLFGATLLGIWALVAVRASTPVWMTLALVPFWVLLTAHGFALLCTRLPARATTLAAFGFPILALMISAIWLHARVDATRSGVQLLPTHRVADLAYRGHDTQRTQPLLGAWQLDRLARRFCADHPATPLFGDIVLGVATAEAMPFLMQGCAPSRWPSLGGNGTSAVAGLVRQSGAVQDDGWPRISGYAFVPVRRVLLPMQGIALREFPPYPPLAWFRRTPETLHFDVHLAADEVLALSSRLRFEPETTTTLTPASAATTTSASSQTRLFRCPHDAGCSFNLQLDTVVAEALQVYTLDARVFRQTDRAE